MQTFNKHIDTNKTTEEIRQQVLAILETVSDPEVPVLSVIDLGIVREIIVLPASQRGISWGLQILITPTYTGCPAIDVMNINMRMALLEAGFTNITIKQVLSPAWTTDWMSENGKEKLKAYGIAPPSGVAAVGPAGGAAPISIRPRNLACPRCGSKNTERLSAFGSTACKALHRCLDCREPFEHFKPI